MKKFSKLWSGKKKIFWLLLVALIVVLVAVKSCGSSQPVGVQVSTMPLAKGSLQSTLSLKAPLEGTESIEVASSLHNEITEIRVKEGDTVAAGQVLAVLDTGDINTQIQMAEADLQAAEANYNDAVASNQRSLAKAQQDYETAKTNYERNKVLYQEGAISQSELETYENAMKDAQREINNYSSQNESNQAAVASARLALQEKREALNDAVITSPIAGTVTRVNVNVGRFADDTEDNKPMFVIENLSHLQLEGSVSEYDIGKLQVGQEATISADILGVETVHGEVARISPTGELKEGSTSERVVPVIITLTESNPKLIAGISATADIVIGEKEDIFVVPMAAIIQNADGSTAVATVENNLLKLVPVTVGLESDIQSEISGEGLTEGMTIITTPPEGAVDGMPVLVDTPEAGASAAQ